MLIELNIRDFAIIDQLRVEFEPGLNVLTGETGAGKSIIIDALGAVLGERIGTDVVRSGARNASVEAIFDVSGMANRAELTEFAREFGIDLDEGTLVLAREVTSGGRSTARINGRATTAGSLNKVGALLVDIHGQSDHLSLLRQSAHLDVLDRFAGVLNERERLATAVRELRRVRASLHDLISGERERERRIDLLTFQVAEITDAALDVGEEERLSSERDVLANAERLAEEATLTYALLAGGDLDDDGNLSALDGLRRASTQMDAIALVDPTMSATAERLRDVTILLEDIVAETRDYRERIEADPARLEGIEERLDLVNRLKRKYGATIEEVIEYGAEAAGELERLTGGAMDVSALRHRESSLLDEIGAIGGNLSARRVEAARELEHGVETAIGELNMGRSRFAVAIEQRPDAHGAPFAGGLVGFDETGIDRVEFLLAANAGEALKPLSRVASGGEMARLMLALKSILSLADETPSLVFDEVDVGVGGRSGQVVGEKLWGLTRDHQVIVITHLPQIAAFAESHYRITKAERSGRTVSNVVRIAGDDRVDEIAAMLDGTPVTQAARENAKQMIARVEAWKTRSGIAA
ncbi:MAG: DNA repair protein RecN [Thermomicrobiales bacterium]|nr:DNA repair protein RecN [Thermomicrobiales bacterium]